MPDHRNEDQRGVDALLEENRRLREERDSLRAEMAAVHSQDPRHGRQNSVRGGDQLRAIIDSTGDSICAIDRAFRLLVFNETYARGFERRFGFSPSVGLDVREPFQDAPSDLKSVIDWWNRALSGEAYALLRETQGEDGETCFYDVRFTPITNAEGRAVGAVSFTRDVTALKQAEAAQRRYNEALGATNRRLQETNRTLEQRNRELEHFTYVAAHDLQEPLRKIQAFSDLLLNEFGERLNEEGQHFLQRTRSAAETMSNLLNDLLAFSRVRTAAQPFEMVDLNEVARETLKRLSDFVEGRKAEVEVGHLPAVEAEPRQIRQLLAHLVHNAIKFQDPGAAPRVVVSSEMLSTQEGEHVLLRVSDNGIGLEPKYVDRIFHPFERLHGSGEYPGTGMGLAICRRIVERHGGAIGVESELGRGSTFTISLPVRQN